MDKSVIYSTKQDIMEAGKCATGIHSAAVLANSEKSQNKKAKGKRMQKTNSAAIDATVGKSKIQAEVKTARPANLKTTELKKSVQIITRQSANNGIKTKGGVILDAGAILKRMLKIAALETVIALAAKLGCSPQALGNSKARKSISFALLLQFCGIYDVTMEYLLYGIKLSLVQPSAALPGEKYLMSPIGIDPGFIQSVYRLQTDNLRWFVDGNNVFYLIDVSTKSIKSNGKFLICGNDYANVFDCKRLIDGSVMIEGEQQPLSIDDLQRHVTILGQAVWSGASL